MSKKETKSAEKEVNKGGMEDSPLLSPFHHTRISSYVPLANSHNIARMESLLAGLGKMLKVHCKHYLYANNKIMLLFLG